MSMSITDGAIIAVMCFCIPYGLAFVGLVVLGICCGIHDMAKGKAA